MGNVVVVKQGTKGADAPRVMVAAHMDEVGLLCCQCDRRGLPADAACGRRGFPRGYQQAGLVRRRGDSRRDRRDGDPPADAPRTASTCCAIDNLYVDIGAKDKDGAPRPSAPRARPSPSTRPMRAVRRGLRISARRWTTAWAATTCCVC